MRLTRSMPHMAIMVRFQEGTKSYAKNFGQRYSSPVRVMCSHPAPYGDRIH
jgi:hypothetical protein